MIRILTGPVKSYKTSTLLHWALTRNGIGGILSPDLDGVRHLYRIADQTWWPWQKQRAENEEDLIIGRFIFDGKNFAAALQWLEDERHRADLTTIIVDEIGPLELSGKGFDQWLQSFLGGPGDKELILVVRDRILEDVLSRYQLHDAHIVQKNYFQ